MLTEMFLYLSVFWYYNKISEAYFIKGRSWFSSYFWRFKGMSLASVWLWWGLWGRWHHGGQTEGEIMWQKRARVRGIMLAFFSFYNNCVLEIGQGIMRSISISCKGGMPSDLTNSYDAQFPMWTLGGNFQVISRP